MNTSGQLSRCLNWSVAAAVILLFSHEIALANCDEDWLSVEQIRDGGSTEFYARNSTDYPVTYSVGVRSTSSGRPRLFRGTLRPQESKHLSTMSNVSEQANDNISISCVWTIGDRTASHDDEHLYLLPYASGKSYRVLQGFGSRFSHRGGEQYAVDFKMTTGTPVHAARAGVVARVVESHNKGCWKDGCGAFANFVVIMHDDGTTGEYYHLQLNGALVEVGDLVEAGQEIGLSGNTGHTALPHLHFAVYGATKHARSQSIPMNFLSADGVIYRPRRGHHYLAVVPPQGEE